MKLPVALLALLGATTAVVACNNEPKPATRERVELDGARDVRATATEAANPAAATATAIEREPITLVVDEPIGPGGSTIPQSAKPKPSPAPTPTPTPTPTPRPDPCPACGMG